MIFPNITNKVRLCERFFANHNLNRLLDKPGLWFIYENTYLKVESFMAGFRGILGRNQI